MSLQRWCEDRKLELADHRAVLAAVGSRQVGQQAVPGALGSSHAKGGLPRTAAMSAGQRCSAALLACGAQAAQAAACLVVSAVRPGHCRQNSHMQRSPTWP